LSVSQKIEEGCWHNGIFDCAPSSDKLALADFSNRGKLTAFWGEQQAVVAFVTAACIFIRITTGKNSRSG